MANLPPVLTSIHHTADTMNLYFLGDTRFPPHLPVNFTLSLFHPSFSCSFTFTSSCYLAFCISPYVLLHLHLHLQLILVRCFDFTPLDHSGYHVERGFAVERLIFYKYFFSERAKEGEWEGMNGQQERCS